MAEGAHDLAAWSVATLYLNVFAKVLNIDVHCILRVEERREQRCVHVSKNLRHRHTTELLRDPRDIPQPHNHPRNINPHLISDSVEESRYIPE